MLLFYDLPSMAGALGKSPAVLHGLSRTVNRNRTHGTYRPAVHLRCKFLLVVNIVITRTVRLNDVDIIDTFIRPLNTKVLGRSDPGNGARASLNFLIPNATAISDKDAVVAINPITGKQVSTTTRQQVLLIT